MCLLNIRQNASAIYSRTRQQNFILRVEKYVNQMLTTQATPHKFQIIFSFQSSLSSSTMKLLGFIVAAFALFCQIDGYKVLGVLPFGSNSHFAIGHSIVKSLLNAGNEVTVISPYPKKQPVKNYRDISTADFFEKHKKGNNH
jgi:hypothetical protein